MKYDRKRSKNRLLLSSQQFSIVVKGSALFSLALVFYLNYRFIYSVFNGTFDPSSTKNSSSIEDSPKERNSEFLSLPAFPNTDLTVQSSKQEWERQSQKPAIGFYRYSSIATINLPASDLEDLKTRNAEVLYRGGNVSEINEEIVVLTRKGHKFNPEDGNRTPNQDRVLVVSKRDGSFRGRNSGGDDWWIGLFDGHGFHGHAVSQYVSSEFSRRINKEWEDEKAADPLGAQNKNIETVKDNIRKTFLDINISIPSFISTSGCTGISVLKRGNLLYISNVGDSVAFVASYNKSKSTPEVKIIYSTRPHKPDTPSERRRIEGSGGRVQDAPFKGASARLMIPVKVGSQIFEIGLAMSRSLGDHDGLKVGLSAEPDTDVLDLENFDKNNEFIVVTTTDGLVDFGKLSEEEVAMTMAEALSTKQTDLMNEQHRKQLRHPPESSPGMEAATQLILKASQLWDSEPGGYRDDISIAARKLII